MKKLKVCKKMLSFLLTLAMLLSSFSAGFSVFAEDAAEDVIIIDDESGEYRYPAYNNDTDGITKVGTHSLKATSIANDPWLLYAGFYGAAAIEQKDLTAVTSNGTAGALRFWVYISDVTLLDESKKLQYSGAYSQVKIGDSQNSSYYWNNWVNQVVRNGWNEVILKFADAAKQGSAPDISAADTFSVRLASGTSPVTMYLDDIRVSADTEPTPAPDDVIVVDDEAGEGYYPAGNNSTDGIYKVGTHSLKATTLASQGWILYAGFWGSAGLPAIDITEVTSGGKDGAFRFWMYVDDISSLDAMKTLEANGKPNRVKLGDCNSPDGKYFVWDGWINQVTESGWNEIILPFAGVKIESSVPDLTAIDTLYMKFAEGSPSVKIYIDDLRITADSEPTPLPEDVIIIDDEAGEGYYPASNNTADGIAKVGTHSLRATTIANEGWILYAGFYGAKNLTARDIKEVTSNGKSGALRFWMYVEDITALDPIKELQAAGYSSYIKIGDCDAVNGSYYGWNNWINQVDESGWNEVVLKFSDAFIESSAPDLTAIDTLYMKFSEGAPSVKIYLDDMRVSANSKATDAVEQVDLPVSLSKSGTGNIAMVSSGFSVDASGVKNPYLQLSVYIARNDDTTSINHLFGGGQIELTSSGKCDVAEIHWSTSTLGLEAGWNTVYLPLSAAGVTENGKAFDISAINYFRIYHQPEDTTLSYSLKVKDVSIISRADAIELNSLYGKGMLFQQNKDVVITGTGNAGDVIDAVIADQSGNVYSSSQSTVSDGGKLTVTLEGLAGGYTEYDIILSREGETMATIEDVVFGELWLASGQSNMEYTMGGTPSAADIIANPTDKYIKILSIPINPASGSHSGNVPYEPQDTINGASWGDGSKSAYVKGCSAVAYYFAMNLREELDMPIGILDANQGATAIYGWLSRAAIEGDQEVLANAKEIGHYRTLSQWNTAGSANYRQMAAMYNQMIHPLRNFSIAGTIWYQGESEINDKAGSYAAALELLLESWSELFGFENNSMPLIASHLAPHYYGSAMFDKAPQFSDEINAVVEKYPENVGQIANYDLPLDYNSGNAPIHPNEKIDVGGRMATVALGLIYDIGEDSASPVYNSVSADGSSLLVKFDNVSEGLAPKTGTVINGFAICGADGIYVPAKAEIVSADTVRVWNDTVKYPVAVTYAYTMMSQSSNLVSTRNGEALLAVIPFCSMRREGEKFYHPVDWFSTETLEQWHSNASVGDYYANWRDGTLNPDTITSISLDENVKTDGDSSLKVDFTTNKYWAFGLSPNLWSDDMTTLLADIDRSLANYDTLSFDIKQETGKELKLHIAVNSGEWYYPELVGLESSDENGAHKYYSLGSGNDWQTVTVDLRSLTDGTGNAVEALLSSISNMEFTFGTQIGASSSGTVYLDNFRLGFYDDKQEVNKQNLLENIQKAQQDIYKYVASSRPAVLEKAEELMSVLNDITASQEAVDAANTEIFATLEAAMLIGDCDLNNTVDSFDLVVLRKLLLGITSEQNEACDTDENGTLNIKDLIRLKKNIAK